MPATPTTTTPITTSMPMPMPTTPIQHQYYQNKTRNIKVTGTSNSAHISTIIAHKIEQTNSTTFSPFLLLCSNIFLLSSLPHKHQHLALSPFFHCYALTFFHYSLCHINTNIPVNTINSNAIINTNNTTIVRFLLLLLILLSCPHHLHIAAPAATYPSLQ